MTPPEKKNTEQSNHDRHLSRNGAPVDPKSLKKQGAGRGNWGSYEDEIEDALHDPSGEQKNPSKINVVRKD
ncbi:hypothetical protein K7432_010151 [Basidiobolus ranarum]|uniref:Hyaluronan/mRNA-binding protein domain-containing protein n=1 Tax=Basidiobolus ranarum TaxID=34480 RepID=A0ABR2WPC9_9FUNG